MDDAGQDELIDIDAAALAEVARPGFVAGLELAGELYSEVVEPLLSRRMPGLAYGAALIGEGSEVLGFDTPVSTDHHWGPRLQLFLRKEDLERHANAIDELLRNELPRELHGFSTSFGPPDEIGVRLLVSKETGPVDHMVVVTTLSDFASGRLGFDPLEGLTLKDWLVTPQQRLLELTAGRVFRDDDGTLATMRETLAFYPEPLWLYTMAAQWQRISDVDPFVGRTGVVGNDTGSRVIAAALVRNLMRLAFLQEKRYAPYEKWLGSAFARLECARRLGPVLGRVLGAYDWTQREGHLGEAYRIVATLHNNLGVTDPLETEPSSFHGRPYKVIHGDRFAKALHDRIDHPAVQGLPRGLGAIDQVTTHVAVLEHHERCRALASLWN
ncbi:MAG: hypothetical protein QOE29_1202 [Gaiellaceae bacterium]|nr:hypothetical protein [Gaiellaceae bacterium]